MPEPETALSTVTDLQLITELRSMARMTSPIMLTILNELIRRYNAQLSRPHPTNPGAPDVQP